MKLKHKIPCAACGAVMLLSSETNRPFTDEDAKKAFREDWVCLRCSEHWSTEKIADLVKRRKKQTGLNRAQDFCNQ